MKTSRRTAVLLLSAGLMLTGCSSPTDTPASEGYRGPTLPARTAEGGHWKEGPAKPVRHKPYPYDLYTHCGIKWARFGGRWWVLDTVFPGVEQVRGKRSSPYAQTLAGYMTLIGPDTANFDAAGMPTLQFVPARKNPPGCD
ncbi:hypothetical protein ACFYW9_01695 [Streptomyces sp. NPDC002698]|uniref:hypothetical protein n=1 Tax=Streptomyces sp. NPDC002698 TaxID=3364660 RepID=UPI0036AB9C7F